MEGTPRVGFWQAFGLFFKNYFNFRGRSTRREYWFMFIWYAVLTVALVGLVFAFILTVVMNHETKGAANLLVGLGFTFVALAGLSLAIIIPMISLHVRRYRDAGVSPWWLLATYLLPTIFSRTEVFGVNAGLSNTLTAVAFVLEIANLVIAAQPSKQQNLAQEGKYDDA